MLKINKFLQALLIVLVFPGAVMVQNNNSELQNLADSFYETVWQANPVIATYRGYHKYDSQLGKYSKENIQEQIRIYNQYLDSLKAIDYNELSLDAQIDYELLKSDILMQIFYLDKIRGWEKNPYEYADECLSGVHTLLKTNFALPEERAKNISLRLAQIPDLLQQAKTNIKNPPKTYAVAAIETFRTGEEFIIQITGDLARQLPKLKKELLANRKKAVKSMQDYRVYLEKMLPNLEDNFAIGKDNFNYMLEQRYMLSYNADSLLAMGNAFLNLTNLRIKELRKQKQEYDSLHPQTPDSSLTAPSDFSITDILNGINNLIDSLRNWTKENNIATVPDYVGQIQAIRTPEFLKVVIPGLAMNPPAPLDSIQDSYVFVPYIPVSLDRESRQSFYDALLNKRWTGGMLHECFPGHFLQLSIANHHPSFIRKIHHNTLTVEGWALYCEEMCAQNWLYPDDGFLDLKWLAGVRFRAARIILDVSLQTGKMTYDDAWQFLVRSLGWDPSYAQNEVRRYTMTPTQPLSYLVGKTEILKLREEYKKKMGDKYSLKDFHDQFLAQGSIPISLIRKKMIGD